MVDLGSAVWRAAAVGRAALHRHKEDERRLLESLREKEVLLSEVHHRVKNNLQIVSSLLSLQAGQLSDSAASRIFSETQSRIQAIALVHEKLYQSDSLSAFSFREYVSELVTALDRAQNGAGRGISLRVAADELELSTDLASTCGLIVNELVTNALKHTFPAGRRGSVVVAGRRLDAQGIALIVVDDGIGPQPLEEESEADVGAITYFEQPSAVKRDFEVTQPLGENGERFCFPRLSVALFSHDLSSL